MTSPERRSLEFPYLFDEFCCLSFWVSGFLRKLPSALIGSNNVKLRGW